MLIIELTNYLLSSYKCKSFYRYLVVFGPDLHDTVANILFANGLFISLAYRIY